MTGTTEQGHECPRCRREMDPTGETVHFPGTDSLITHRVYYCHECGAGWHFREQERSET